MYPKSRKQRAWMVVFLGVTATGIGLELLAAFDDSTQTIPWTDLIVEYVPAEVAAVVFGALALWLPVHFGRRYLMKARGVDWRAAARKNRRG